MTTEVPRTRDEGGGGTRNDGARYKGVRYKGVRYKGARYKGAWAGRRSGRVGASFVPGSRDYGGRRRAGW